MPAAIVTRLAEITDTYRELCKSGPELWNAQIAAQEEANRLWLAGDAEAARQLLLDAATATHAPYPQYVGHWAHHTLGRIERGVRLKGGTLPKGDVVLVAPEDGQICGVPTRSFYSVRRDSDVGVEPHRVRRF